jgi:hypothetical protein
MAALDAAQTEHYKSLEMASNYAFHPGSFVIPLAEEVPTNPVEAQSYVPFVVVQAHAPYRLRNVQYNAVKNRNPPVIPAPVDQGAYTFLGGTVNLPHPAVQTDGSLQWGVFVNYLFAEECRSDTTVGLVIGNSVDALAIQAQNVNFQNYSDAPPNVTGGGVGPKAGWTLAKLINLNSPSWSYTEPSYFPAQLFSAEMVGGSTTYPEVTP